MNCYFDTSALMKAYIEETGTERVLELLDETDRVTVAPIVMVECASVLSRIHTQGNISPQKRGDVIEALQADLGFFEKVSFDDEIEREAIRISSQHRLRSLDAIQLAGALVCSERVDVFVSSDKRLLEAARKERLRVEDPTA